MADRSAATALVLDGGREVGAPESGGPLTTTISTIAVQSGHTRIVIALLQSKEWLQLKIQEMHPAISEIGTCLEEAATLRMQHDQALERLQTKQSPVEELLNQADELISNQRPRAEVYSAMAENLGLAWKDLNAQLEQRRQILEQAVLFFTRAREFSDRMDAVSKDFNDTFLPEDADTCRMLLQRLHEEKKGVLECSMRTLSEGQVMQERLCEVATHSMGDSRPAHMRHVAQQTSRFLEQFMESLHDRKRHLEAAWLIRKTRLEQCLQKCLIYHDLREIQHWLKSKGADYLSHSSLGDSAASAEILQHELHKMETEFKEIQDRAIRLLRTAEAAAPGHYAGEEMKTSAYCVLEECSEFLAELDNRRHLLGIALIFFNLAQTALNKLDQIEVQVTTLEHPRPSLQAQLTQTVEDIVGPAIREGRALIATAGPQGSQGVARKVSELEGRRITLLNLCAAQKSETQEQSAAMQKFHKQHTLLSNWLVNIGLAFLQGHQDMGSVYPMAKDFFDKHERLQNDLRMKGLEVDALLSSVSGLMSAGGEEAQEVHRKAENLRGTFEKLRAGLEGRLRLAQVYLNFHKLASQLGKEMDCVEEVLKTDRSQCSENVIRQTEEKWLSVQQQMLQLNNLGKNFIADARKADEPHLDTGRAIVCVEDILEQFQLRRTKLTNRWEEWKRQLAAGKEQQDQWEIIIRESHKILTTTSHFEMNLFPVIPGDLNGSDVIADFLERHLTMILPKIKSHQCELESQIKCVELFLAPSSGEEQKRPWLDKLVKTHQDYQAKITEYQVLVSLMITFFRNMKEVEKVLNRHELSFKTRSVVLDPEAVLREHEGIKQAVGELFRLTNNEADQLIDKVEAVEPPDSAIRDKDKINSLILLKKTGFERVWENHKRQLEQNVQYSHFSRDLKQINLQIDQLNNQLVSMRGNYGESLPSAIATSQAFIQFEKTLELLEIRIQMFVSTAEKMLREQHVDSESIHVDLQNLQTKWSSFHMQVGENRRLIELSIQYFRLVEEAENWFQEGSKVLILIARRSTTCRTPQEATSLLYEVESFLKPGETKQEERIQKISELAVQLYGHKSHSSTVQVSGKNREMLDSFAAINGELSVLARNLREAQEEKDRERREKEETSAALQAETASAKAAASAAMEAVRAAEAVVKSTSILSQEFHQRTVIIQQQQQQQRVQTESVAVQAVSGAKSPQAPVFVIPLADTTVMEGARVTFECKLEGFPTPHVQWLKDGILIQNNPDYQVVSSPDGFCSLTIEESFTEDSARFTCRATNSAGTADTQGKLFVKEAHLHEELIPPHFLRELHPGWTQEGQPFTFECQVAGNPLPLVSWFKNDACVDNSPDHVITSNNGTCLLSLREASLQDEARYSCRASNQAGQIACSAKLTVTPRSPLSAPIVLLPLSNVMARAGQKLRLECHFAGQPEPTVAWTQNGRPIRENVRDVKFQIQYEGGQATLVINEAFPKDAGVYVVQAKNEAGEVASSCNVSVKGRLPLETSDSEMASDMEPVKPQVMRPLKDQTVLEGTRTRFDCVIVGQPEPEVIWYHNGKPVKESDDFQLLFEGDCCTLIIKEAYLEDAGAYKCVAINSGGEASSHCNLRIEPLSEVSDAERSQREVIISVDQGTAPRFIQPLNDLSSPVGSPLCLSCKVTGKPRPGVTWLKDGQDIIHSQERQMAHSPDGTVTLRLPSLATSDAGDYAVRASNEAGEAKCFCNLSVSQPKAAPTEPIAPKEVKEVPMPPTFLKYLEDLRVPRGHEAKFECTVTGTPKPKVQWCFRGWPLQADPSHTMSELDDNHRLVIPEVKTQHTGRYSLTAENDTGKAVSSAALVVDDTFEDKSLVVDGFNEQRVQSMVMSRKSTVVQRSRLSRVSEQLSENGTCEVHQVSSVSQHSRSQMGGQDAREFHSQQTDSLHQVNHLMPDVKQVTLPSVLTIEQVHSDVETDPASAPKFVSPLRSTLVREGDKIKLEGRLTGVPEPEVRWFKSETELFSGPAQTITYSTGTVTLVISEAKEADTGHFSCRASNPAGISTSSADVVVKPHRVAPKFLKLLEAKVVTSGDRVQLDVEVDGTPEPEVKWFRNGTQLENTPDFRIRQDGRCHSAVIPEAFPDDSGKLTVKASNAAGEAQSIADLVVEELASPPEFSFKQYSLVEQKHQVSFPVFCSWDCK